MDDLTYGSTFTGIGGFDLAFDRAGMTCLFQVEIDAAARSVLDRHWPHVPKFADMRDVGAHNLPSVDVLVGGFPCQDLSVAGNRAGLAGERSGLFYELVRVTHELRPAFLLFENVPGLLSSHNGRDFAAVLMALDVIGYSGAWTTLDAQYFGLAQRRRRVFGLFARRDIGAARCAEILALKDRLYRHPTPSREARQDVAARSGVSFKKRGGFGWSQSEGISSTLESEGGTHQGGPERVPLVAYQCHGTNVGEIGTLRHGNGHVTGGVPFVTHSLTGEGFDASKDGTGGGTPLVPMVAPCLTQNYDKQPDNSDTSTGPMLVPISIRNGGRDSDNRENRTGIGLSTDTAHTLQGEQQHAVLAFTSKDYGGDAGELAPTLRSLNFDKSHMNGGGQVAVATFDERNVTSRANRSRVQYGAPANTLHSEALSIITPMAVRRLTPVECERLQGFPDGWTEGQADSSRYRQLGNAVPVSVIEWIAKRLVKALREVPA